MTESETNKRPLIQKKRSYWKIVFLILFLAMMICLLGLMGWEMKTSRLQARIFSEVARKFSYHVEQGENKDLIFPSYGPYDIRLGYDRIQKWILKMGKRDFDVAEQARWSPELLDFTQWGVFPAYHEKTQAGLHIFDAHHREIFSTVFPRRIYPDFESIPGIVIQMLLFIEDRNVLDTSTPYRNPAIEWDRMAKAIFDAIVHIFNPSQQVPGGSTLATQMEKFRHSSEGITDNAPEKLRQIVSASLRSYISGEKTEDARKQIVLNYINSIPLAAARDFGEVNGLGDGLWVWYGIDFQTFNQILSNAGQKNLSHEQLEDAAVALKSALSLFIAQRRPSAYLIKNRKDLENLTNSYLHLLSGEGLIPVDLCNAALTARLKFNQQTALNYSFKPGQGKAANIMRSRLLSDLGIGQTYNLDRVDLTVGTSIDLGLQQKITETLNSLKDPLVIEKAGLKAPYLLESGDPSHVIYSISLFEKTLEGNALRVQTNNYEGQFNIDEQMKLDLGSSAKLRTLVHYLEIMAELYDRYAGLSDATLRDLTQKPADPLTRWAVDYLLNIDNRRLPDMLEAAMDRMYSASPAQQFMTGGGLHTFANFNKEDNFKVMPLRQAFRNSVNLVFIRLMKDISYYHIFQRYGVTPGSIGEIDASEKKRLLTLFADKEGITFIKRFYYKYHQKTAQAASDLLFMQIRPAPHQLTAVFRFLEPEAPVEELAGFLRDHLPDSDLSEPFVSKVYTEYEPGKFSLADIGYISHVHPLELWVVNYLQKNPRAALSTVIAESADERQTVYHWLFKTKNPYKQIKRIRTIIELEAFEDILQAWKKLGYPFDYLVPSYATAIGSSGDRPGALAELAGIIQSNGKRVPIVRIESLHFAKDTPYETVLERKPAAGEPVLEPEVARIVKQAMTDVVEEGTARRLKAILTLSDGTQIPIGGKTGTGDHRYKTFGPGGVLIGSKVMNRAATFVFFIGDRFFGSITAYVPGRNAEDYSFSSALPVQILKMMIPDLVLLVEGQKNTPSADAHNY